MIQPATLIEEETAGGQKNRHLLQLQRGEVTVLLLKLRSSRWNFVTNEA